MLAPSKGAGKVALGLTAIVFPAIWRGSALTEDIHSQENIYEQA